MPSLQSATIGILVVLMTFAVGLRVTPRTMLTVMHRRSLVARVLVVNVVAVPLIGVAITTVMRPLPAVGAAMLLCAAAPGGPLGPVLAGLARADLPFAAGLTVVLAVVSVATTPLVATLTVPQLAGVRIEMLPVFRTVVAFQLAPLGLGMAIARLAPRLAERLATPAATAANFLLAALVIGLVATRAAILAELGLRTMVAMTTFVVATLVAGARLARSLACRRAAALSTGIRNLALALLLADTYLGGVAADAALLPFGAIMLGVPTAAALRWRRGPSGCVEVPPASPGAAAAPGTRS